MTGTPLELFRKVFAAVRANFWFCGSFLAPDYQCLAATLGSHDSNRPILDSESLIQRHYI